MLDYAANAQTSFSAEQLEAWVEQHGQTAGLSAADLLRSELGVADSESYWDAVRTNGGTQRLYFARSADRGATWSALQDVSLTPMGSNNLFPALAARGDGDVRIAWMDDRNGFDPGGDDPAARWNVYYRASANGGATWSAVAKLSQYAPGYAYKYAQPKDGFAEPYGDYFELDVDGAGQTHALWGEGLSYTKPSNIWYARGQ